MSRNLRSGAGKGFNFGMMSGSDSDEKEDEALTMVLPTKGKPQKMSFPDVEEESKEPMEFVLPKKPKFGGGFKKPGLNLATEDDQEDG